MDHVPNRQRTNPPPVALTIAGFDPSSGAGITADLQVFAAHQLFGVSAITALTVQSTLGVAAVQPVAPELLRHTLEHLADDIRPAGIKIGMLGSAAAVLVVANFLRTHLNGATPFIPIVFDPVLRSSSGASLLDAKGVAALNDELLPLVSWITPNREELEVLTGMVISSREGTVRALQELGERHPQLNAVATGGDDEGDPIDLWRAPDGAIRELRGHRVATSSTHGTGCAFSSALLTRLVLGAPPTEAVAAAKFYVEGALRSAPGLGKGKGPMGLLWPILPPA